MMTPALRDFYPDIDDANMDYAAFGLFFHASTARRFERLGDPVALRAALLALMLDEPPAAEKRIRARVNRAREKHAAELTKSFERLAQERSGANVASGRAGPERATENANAQQ
jgi:hypothetical protein